MIFESVNIDHILRIARHYYHVQVHYATVIPVSYLASFSVDRNARLSSVRTDVSRIGEVKEFDGKDVSFR